MKTGKKLAALFSALGLMFALNTASAETYTASAQGMGGNVPVTVTMESGKITDITVGDNNETQGIGDKAIEALPSKIVEQQSLVVDAVAGATITSNAILSAAKTALTEAGVDIAPFMVKQEIVLPEGEAEETDVVIVGAGLAGLMAAYELKTDYPNISYILVEKLDMITGSIPVTGSAILATTSRLHQADNHECSVQDIVDLFEYTSGTTVNETLVSNVYEHSDVVLNRLLDMGTNFPSPSLSSKYSDKVYCYFHENSGAGFAKVLNAYFEANPLALRTGTKAENLLVEDGKVVGVHVTDSEKTYDIRSKAVILATGGFGSSPEYMEKYLPLFADGFFSTNAGATGDGITMTAQFGTPVVGDGSMGSIVEEDGSALIQSNFLVNNTGKRFIGEGEPKYVIQRAVSQQNNKDAWLIADSTYADTEKLQNKLEKGQVKQYDTLEALAQDNGIDVSGLLATVEAYNTAANNGEDIPADEYALANSAATKIEVAPYYIEKVTLRTFGTIPGLQVNETCQILDGNGAPVENLYGVGELIAGNAFTRQYPGAGVGISWAANTGRFAAEVVAEQLR